MLINSFFFKTETTHLWQLFKYFLFNIWYLYMYIIYEESHLKLVVFQGAIDSNAQRDKALRKKGSRNVRTLKFNV